MRQTQAVFEATLKPLVQKDPLIQDYWGFAFESLTENDDHVLSTILDASGNSRVVKSRYVIGCDGAGSKVRLNTGLKSPRLTL
jgi:2-polyprenyl-6-methoxyphenol hydroxylase-like FAD-dependent oxidoreductase